MGVRYPRVTDWYARVSARPSLDAATAPWLDEAAIDKIRQVGRRTFIEDADFRIICRCGYFHLIEQPIEAICASGPRPVAATSRIA